MFIPTIVAETPKRTLLPNSVDVRTTDNKTFFEWTKENHRDSHALMSLLSRNLGAIDRNLICGKVQDDSFSWQVVPYLKCNNFLTRAVQQIKVLWRIVFGGVEVPEKERRQLAVDVPILQESPEVKGKDPFCTGQAIDKQWVIQGKKVDVLFNFAPIGFGGEKLHFLVVPKAHRAVFAEVSPEEYAETMELTEKLLSRLKESRKSIKSIYLFNKSGKDAGQVIDHWMLQVICCTNAAQDIFGKLQVLKNILFGSSRMSDKALSERVTILRAELEGIVKKDHVE